MKKQLFGVDAKGLKIDGLGTKFNVVDYDDDTQTEVTLSKSRFPFSYEYYYKISQYHHLYQGNRT
jgi:ferric-dicitrate binding protein FerR (iron transport regulator)